MSSASVPDVPTKGSPQVAVRLDPEMIETLDELARKASTPLRELTRADLLRYSIKLGIEKLREEYGVADPKPARAKAVKASRGGRKR